MYQNSLSPGRSSSPFRGLVDRRPFPRSRWRRIRGRLRCLATQDRMCDRVCKCESRPPAELGPPRPPVQPAYTLSLSLSLFLYRSFPPRPSRGNRPSLFLHRWRKPPPLEQREREREREGKEARWKREAGTKLGLPLDRRGKNAWAGHNDSELCRPPRATRLTGN